MCHVVPVDFSGREAKDILLIHSSPREQLEDDEVFGGCHRKRSVWAAIGSLNDQVLVLRLGRLNVDEVSGHLVGEAEKVRTGGAATVLLPNDGPPLSMERLDEAPDSGRIGGHREVEVLRESGAIPEVDCMATDERRIEIGISKKSPESLRNFLQPLLRI